MCNKTTLILVCILIISCFILHIDAKVQKDLHSHMFKQKLLKKKDIGITDFNIRDYYQKTQVLSHEELKEQDLIEILPGQPGNVSFRQYAGYVTVDENTGQAFFYYFVEAEKSSDTLPLLLWLNGGPGCSSFGYGAMSEIGPFGVLSDGKTLYKKNHAWNKVANVLFWEFPAGVGFSYSNTTLGNFTTDDTKTARANYIFLVNWLNRFPEYKNRDIFIAGESYAGHYVPQLMQTILLRNKMPNNPIINVKGAMFGNGVIDRETDLKGEILYYASHALISEDSANEALKYCDYSETATNESRECNEAYEKVDKEFGDFGIDSYNIYAPLCLNDSLTQEPKENSETNPDPCRDDYVYAYLNRAEVQKAFHANLTDIPYAWEQCSDVVLENWNGSTFSIIPILKDIMAEGLRLWIYSGDTDAMVPVTSTQLSIKKMKLDIQTQWHPWYFLGEVGGYTQIYKNLTFATVRDAGHEVPVYQPGRSLYLIQHFLAGIPLSNSSI